MLPTRSLLVVEDDDAVRQLLADQLVSSGLFHVAEAATLAKASQHLDAPDVQCDAIILDISLPDGDGCDFCARIRKQGHMMPILMLTGAAGEDDVVSALNAGANDYLVKPFRVNELLARLQAQLRLFDASENAVLTIGSSTFRPGAKLLIGADKTRRLHLTSKEVGLLKFLHRHANQVVSRETLLEVVWGYHAGVTTHTLETHIPPAPEDRNGSGQRSPADDRAGWLPTGSKACRSTRRRMRPKGRIHSGTTDVCKLQAASDLMIVPLPLKIGMPPSG